MHFAEQNGAHLFRKLHSDGAPSASMIGFKGPGADSCRA
jgi:hypothetical protein